VKIYVGIDIGKRKHEACFLNEVGKVVGNLKFQNTLEGTNRLVEKLGRWEEVVLGLEATGHYWLNLYTFLLEHDYQVKVINPVQSDSLRKVFIRTHKTDKKDSFLIAELLRIGRYTESKLADETTLELQSLSRLRWELVEMTMGLKQRVICLVDRIFPEYEKVFSSLFVKSSRAILSGTASPQEILELPLKELSSLLQQASRGSQSKGVKSVS
jgi:transposase